MRRTIYLIIYTSPLFPAHWSLWIPRKDKPSVGKRIHAEGNSHSGFTIAFERNYNIDEDGRRYQLIALADVADACVEDSRRDEDELPSTDQVPCDRVEEVALGVEAPGKSLKEVGTEGPRHRVEVKNCQTWLRDVVTALVEGAVMDNGALSIIENAPKN